MRFWWLIPLVLVAVAAATGVGWWFARRAGQRSGKKGWVANSGYLRGLPKYQALVRRTRSSLAMALVCFIIAVIAASVSAAAPVELIEYLQPTLPDDDEERASLVGDGLASCVMGFDHKDKTRSRTILLATDNEVWGEGIYNLSEAIAFAKRQNVTVTALYPGSMDMLSSEAIDLRDQVQSTGGDFYDASSPASVDSVVQQIEAEQKEDLDSNGKMLETDRPTAALGWTLVGVVSLLGLLAFGRL